MLEKGSTTAATIKAYQIASDIVLNTQTNTLSNKGVSIELENRLVSLLAYFIDHQNEVLQKERVIKTIWQGKVVNDDSLAVAVSYLRKALGDNSRAPQFIKTIPGVGYQFIAQAQPILESGETDADPLTTTTTYSSAPKNIWRITLIASSVLLALAIFTHLYFKQKPLIARETTSGDTTTAAQPNLFKPSIGYQTAIRLLNTNEPENWRLAIKAFRDLIASDGESAELYVGLANAKIQLLNNKISIKENCKEVVGLLEKAVTLNADLATAHHSLANSTFWCQRDYTLAEQHYLRAIQLNPKDDSVLISYAQLLLAQRRFSEALAQTEQARRLNPLHYSVPDIVWILQMQGRDDLAARELDRILTTEPDNRYYHISAQRIFKSMNDSDKAFAQLQWLMRDSGISADALKEIEQDFKRGGLEAVNEWLLTHKVNADLGDYSPPLSWARYALAAKKYDVALDHLEAAYEERQAPMLWAGIDPAYEPVRNHPRFQKILDQLKTVENK